MIELMQMISIQLFQTENISLSILENRHETIRYFETLGFRREEGKRNDIDYVTLSVNTTITYKRRDIFKGHITRYCSRNNEYHEEDVDINSCHEQVIKQIVQRHMNPPGDGVGSEETELFKSHIHRLVDEYDFGSLCYEVSICYIS